MTRLKLIIDIETINVSTWGKISQNDTKLISALFKNCFYKVSGDIIRFGINLALIVRKISIMEHKTVKKILIGLFFCVVLFVLSFMVEENSDEVSPINPSNTSKAVAEDNSENPR